MLADVMIDGQREDDFRQSIETMLRQGDADLAAARLQPLLEPLCGEGLPLPARFATVSASDLAVTGWDAVLARIADFDAAGTVITAVGADLSAPVHFGIAPDDQGLLDPIVETNFYTDAAWAFSQCDRDALLGGYTAYGCEWQGGFEHIDDCLRVTGVADLYGAVVALEERVRGAGPASEDERSAHLLASSLFAVLFHQALRDTVPDALAARNTAVVVGSNESFPFFDAPAVAACADNAPPRPLRVFDAEMDDADADPGEHDAAATASLLDIGQRPPETALPQPEQGLAPDLDKDIDEDALLHHPHEGQISGTQLRRRFITPESLAAAQPEAKPSLLSRLFRRK